MDIWFVHLKDKQDVRSGDTLCLDYRVIGLEKLPQIALKTVTFAVYVNGTAWHEAKIPISPQFAVSEENMRRISFSQEHMSEWRAKRGICRLETFGQGRD